MNWYAYAGNNPVTGADPSGEEVYAPWDSRSTWYHVFTNDENAWSGFGEGQKIVSDLVNPFGDPYADGGWYDLCDPVVGASRAMATIGVAAGGLAVGITAVEAVAARVAASGGLAAAVKELTNGQIRLDLFRAGHPVGADIMEETGMPRATAGQLYAKGEIIPHVNIGAYHVIINSYNWYNPLKWFVK